MRRHKPVSKLFTQFESVGMVGRWIRRKVIPLMVHVFVVAVGCTRVPYDDDVLGF